MNMNSKDLQILKHIVDYCEKIEATVVRFGNDFEIFAHDSDYLDSVSMNLLQIGELSGKLSDEYSKETRAQIDWRAIKAMRNLFAHNYGSMDIEEIWNTVVYDIPGLKAYCAAEINKYIYNLSY